jgi:2-phospho-L-lactate guanylyltransferase
MNAAVVRGLEAVADQGAEGALVLTADLPLARPEDIAAILAHPLAAPSALLVPSADGTGTNAMLLRPPTALRPRLGPDSFARHGVEALQRGLGLERLERPGLALDIDTPTDLIALMGTEASCATLEMCARLEVGLLLGVGSAL